MSNYKEGDKFIIEIGHGTVDPLYGARYYIKGFNTLVFDDNGLERLEQVNCATLRDIYDGGFEKGLEEGRNEKDCNACRATYAKANADYNAGYEDGLCEAWECAKTIANYNAGEIYDRFGVRFMAEVLDKFSASEAENRIVEHEAKQNEIKIGDEVRIDNQLCVVLTLNTAGNYCLLRGDGKIYIYPSTKKNRMTKTGRHYYIDRILEQMKGADDD